jgi:hypothetical protein
MFIPDPDFFPPRIQQKKEEEKNKLVVFIVNITMF